LIFLPLAVALAGFSTWPMQDPTRQAVATFAPVELRQNASTVGLIVNLGQEVEGLGDPADLANRAGEH
jgi:hypothetical protein